jgi:hypothetical protein
MTKQILKIFVVSLEMCIFASDFIDKSNEEIYNATPRSGHSCFVGWGCLALPESAGTEAGESGYAGTGCPRQAGDGKRI